jgi:hypothetical protein
MPAKSPPKATSPPVLVRRRRWPLALAAGLGLVVGAHAIAWLWLVLRLEDGIALWVAARRAEGWDISHGPPARGGWPMAAQLAMPAVSLRHGGLGWQAQQVTLTLEPRRLDRLTLGASGPQRLDAGGQQIPLATEGLVMTLPLEVGGYAVSGLPRDATLSAGRLRLDLPEGALDLAAPRLALAAGDGRGPEDPLLRLHGMATSLTLPPALASQPGVAVLGSSLDRIAIDLVAGGPWPGAAGSPAARAAAWRAGGGSLEVRELGFGWGAARLGTTGRLALDTALQPAGEGMLRLTGAAAVLDAARAAGLIGRREVAGAQMLLSLMQRTPPEGGPPQLQVPMALEGRRLSLGGLSVAQIPPLAWPASPR